MRRFAGDGVELEYEEHGSREPVVLVHAGGLAEWFTPLLRQPALIARYRIVSYHRIGYAASSRVPGPVSIAQHATHLRSLMRHLAIQRAHIVGHSSGGNIALQLALDEPDMAASIALLEPALTIAPVAPGASSPTSPAARPFMAAALERLRAGDKAGALDTFLRGVAGPDYREALERGLPGAFDRGLADVDTFFEQELPAVWQWPLDREIARRIRQPVLAVIGERSVDVSPVWRERQARLLDWLPNVEGFVLPGAAHLLHVENPRGMAEALAAFFARHPADNG